ncbi:MAG: BamA/TamA family outer membrane protein [Fluviicola sp.]|nr:BamA/TamA family outer membrane protein [Fluviicola sp.]
MKYIVLFLYVCLNICSIAQEKQSFAMRYLNRVFNDTVDKSKPQFIAYPILAYAPETSVEIGVSSLFMYYAKRDTTNRLSEVNALGFYTLQQQYGGIIDHANYSHKNNWFFLGKLKFQSFPLSYHGIGPESPSEKIARVDAFQFQLKERVLRKIYKNVYVGLETDLHHLGKVDFVDSDTSIVYEKPAGSEGSTNMGFGLGLLYDNRHNVLNVRHGFFSEVAFLHYTPNWGSDFEFTSVYADMRWFKPILERNVLATQVIGQFTYGNPPFNQLALLGGETMMRGYYLGRFRDRNLMAAQIEYRMLPVRFAKRWGASVFAGTGAVYSNLNNLTNDHILFAGGAGLRFQLFRKKDVWIRLDLAFTNEGNGLYIFVGEAF